MNYSIKTGLIILLLIGVFYPVTAQQLAAFQDNRDHFFIFYNGIISQAEYLPVKSWQAGGTCLLYVDSRNQLKMFYNGKVTTLEANAAGPYHVLDYLAAYSFAGVVKIIEKGKVTTIATNVTQYLAEDSLIVFYDRGRELLAVYYKGKVETLEDGLAGRSFSGLVAGDNLIAWVSAISNNLKAYYQGSTIVVDPFFSGNRYKAGRDILAYISASDQKFRAFYKGVTRILEEFPPVSYMAGDGIVAYTDYSGRFKVFSNGSVSEISSFEPDFYRVHNRMVVFGEQGYFKTWYNNELYVLENYVPADWKAEWNTIVYRDINRNVKVFRDGENKVLTYDLVEDIHLNRDIIVVDKGMSNYNVYYKGQKY